VEAESYARWARAKFRLITLPGHVPGALMEGKNIMIRLLLLVMLSGIAIRDLAPDGTRSVGSVGDDQRAQERREWVAQVLQQMETIRPGMTRKDLLQVFTTEGGLSTPLQRTFISRECPYFKVDVQFKAVGRPSRDPRWRISLDEDNRDIIVQVSRPYLQFSIYD
jgi:hypothetical protein